MGGLFAHERQGLWDGRGPRVHHDDPITRFLL